MGGGYNGGAGGGYSAAPDAPGVTCLEVASNQFTAQGVATLLSVLPSNGRLRRLDVSLNYLGPRAMGSCLEGVRRRIAAHRTRALTSCQVWIRGVESVRVRGWSLGCGASRAFPNHPD